MSVSARRVALRVAVGAALASLLLAASDTPPAAPFPLTETQAQQRALAAACAGRGGWSDAAPPARLFGNSFYVGTCGITAVLVTGPDGHVLIDGATAEGAPHILASIRAAGFDPRDIMVIVGTHEHHDHMGGFAALKAATGARLLVREPARAVLESGHSDADDPQHGLFGPMDKVTVDAVIADGDVVRVGPLALTAVATPGHTAGGTSWHWRSCDGARCMGIAFIDSLTAVSRDDYRFSDHLDRVATFRTTFARVRTIPGDLFITAHPGFSNLFARLAGNAPLIDWSAGRRLVNAMQRQLDARLALEEAETADGAPQ